MADVVRIEVAELSRREPALAGGALGAVHVPREFLIDPWSAPLAYALQAMAHGARVLRNAAVTAAQFDGDGWTIETTRGTLRAGCGRQCGRSLRRSRRGVGAHPAFRDPPKARPVPRL